jgi:crossover junction endodeoxyribonuclease RuvC
VSLFNPAPVVVGLDLSLTATGVATSSGTKIVDSTGHKGDTLDQRRTRLIGMTERIINEVTPLADLVVIEAPAFSRTQGAMHDRSGLWWLVVAALHDGLANVTEVAPTALKKYITGKGNAPKGDMRMEIFKRFGVDIRDDNEADAFALRALGLDLLGHPLVQMPVAHRAGLEKLHRPTLRGAA